jgi:hypothetical protein
MVFSVIEGVLNASIVPHALRRNCRRGSEDSRRVRCEASHKTSAHARGLWALNFNSFVKKPVYFGGGEA